MDLLESVLGIANKLKINFSWIYDTMVERTRNLVLESPRMLPDCKTLILAPHSDDEWIGCSQIIQGNTEVLICNMDMPGGDSESLHAIRYKEMLSLSTRFNRRVETVASDKRAEGLLDVIKSYRPEVVFLPFFTDWHEEHIAVMKTLESVAEFLDGIQIGMYPVSLPLGPRYITHYRPLGKRELEFKWKTFKTVYRTQAHALPWRRFAANERINGAFFKTYAAEVYSVMPVEEWLRCLRSKTLTGQQKRVLKDNLNSISRVRRMLSHFAEINESRSKAAGIPKMDPHSRIP